MNICIPVNEDNGLGSTVCAHFGSAPFFMLVDTDSGTCRAITNHNQHHGHGMCAPLATLQGESIDAMVVGGIGMGALNKLMAAGIQVYVSQQPTVALTVDALKAGTLALMQPGMACPGHGGPHS
jgi:predicted Fe-Mo cluster-binding NifX family protein